MQCLLLGGSDGGTTSFVFCTTRRILIRVRERKFLVKMTEKSGGKAIIPLSQPYSGFVARPSFSVEGSLAFCRLKDKGNRHNKVSLQSYVT